MKLLIHPSSLYVKLFFLCFVTATSINVQARIVRITIEQREPVAGGKSFGMAGPYERLSGHAYGELDPRDPLNAMITDLQLAPRNAQGMVEYAATFTLLKPVDVTKSNGTMIYAVPNRGNRILSSAFSAPGEVTEEFFMQRGYLVLHSGWQGDLPPRTGMETIQVPIAKNPDGTSITGSVLARFINLPAGTKTLALPAGHTAASLDTTQALLTQRISEEGAIVPLSRSDWSFGDCSKAPFPGTPDANQVCLKDGFDPAYLYELTYPAKDPLVLGIGFAATRDLVSFFRREEKDRTGTANPLGNRVTFVIAQGISQSGNFIKTFIHLGFNEDEAHRIVWNGANDHIAGRQLALNIRFAHPGGAANLYEPGSEGVLWWGKYEDTIRGHKPESLLDRCAPTQTCPKIFETFGSAEFWGLRMSPNLVGPAANADIPLPPNVRRYYFPGTTHGGGRGGFSTTVSTPPTNCELPNNLNAQTDTMRALFLALTDWVVKDTAPPPSQYPQLALGQLARPQHEAMGFPAIPHTPLPENQINPFFDYEFGKEFKTSDLSGVLSSQPPAIKRIFPLVVPKTDADGNEIGGIPSALHRAPLGTYLGWNVTGTGFYKGRSCGFAGGFVPFAKTKDERIAKGDPRLSLEERYRDHAGYVAAVRQAIEQLQKQRFLLEADAQRLLKEAEASDVLR